VSPVPGETRIWPILILEWADHGDLAEFLQKNRLISYEEKIYLALDFATGLQTIHAAGFHHRDIKMENVLVFENNENRSNAKYTAKITDFGFSGLNYRLSASSVQSETLSSRGLVRIVGRTEMWSAPEALTEGSPKALAWQDTYAWGLLVLAIMIGGSNPFELYRRSQRNRQRSTVNPSGRNPSVTLSTDSSSNGEQNIYELNEEAELLAVSRKLKNSSESELASWVSTCLSKPNTQDDVAAHKPQLLAVLLKALDRDPLSRDLAMAMSGWNTGSHKALRVAKQAIPTQCDNRTGEVTLRDVWPEVSADLRDLHNTNAYLA